MGNLLWRVVERRLRRILPRDSAGAALGDLAEDYARCRSVRGFLGGNLWLLRETYSLAHAYRPSPSAVPSRLMLGDDIRQACRRLAARPGLPALCAALLAVGIGLATAMFSIVDALLFRPAPFPAADRIVVQTLFDPEPALMEAWKTSGLFEAVEAAQRTTVVPGGDDATAWAAARVTPGVFDMLGVRPLLGRLFVAGDAGQGAGDPVILSERVWRTAFGADRALAGRRITLDGVPRLVIAVLPETFRFPTPQTVVWLPLAPALAPSIPTTIAGRLEPHIPFEDVADRLRGMAGQFARIPSNYIGGPPVHPIAAREPGVITRSALFTLLGGVMLVFVVLCANVASLLLTGMAGRRREFGLCTALGASRGRLLRRSAAEHALVALAGAAGGVGIAAVLTSAVPDFFRDRTLNLIDLDMRALAAACGFGIASVVISGLVPAWLGTRSDPMEALKGARESGTETSAARMAGRALLIVELALACALLVGSGLLLRSFANLVLEDRGLSTEGIMRVRIGGMDDAFGSGEAMALAAEALERRFAAWPAVERVALSREVPPGLTSDVLVHLGAPGAKPDLSNSVRAEIYRVGASFFELHQIPIVGGRHFAPGDAETDVIVGERLARLLWPGADPVGKSFAIGSSRQPRRVVGVAREIRLPTLDASLDLPEFYTPLGRQSRTLYLNFRCDAVCPSEADVRAQVLAVHPGLRPRVTSASEDEYARQLHVPRAVAEAAGIFAIVSVLAAAGGLFGLLTHAVSRRRREFGIRSALGASASQLGGLIFRETSRIAATGIAAGALGGWFMARSLSAMHYGVTPADPLTWVAVIVTLALTSAAAAWRPARQAMRADPARLLREN